MIGDGTESLREGQVRLVGERRGQYARRERLPKGFAVATGLKRLANPKAVITNRLPGSDLHSVLG
jgi:hypothetical protein